MKYFSRISAHDSFLNDALEYYQEFSLLLDSYMATERKTENRDIFTSLNKKLDLASTNFLIYVSLFIEGFIYDYAARNLGDKYSKEHIDRIDVVSKWIIVPKLVSGKEIDRSRHSFEILQKIIKLRNEVIHFKSKAFDIKNQNANDFLPIDKQIDFKEVIEALIDLGNQIMQNDPEDSMLKWEFKPLKNFKI